MDIRGYMAALPEMVRFLAVDEMNADFARLAGEHPGIARLERVGSSSLGEPISMLSIGTGERQILLFACPTHVPGCPHLSSRAIRPRR